MMKQKKFYKDLKLEKINDLPNWIKWSKVKGKYIIVKRK